MTEVKAAADVRKAFRSVAGAIEDLTPDEQRRVLRAVAILLEHDELAQELAPKAEAAPGKDGNG